jgi:hypothetical protein
MPAKTLGEILVTQRGLVHQSTQRAVMIYQEIGQMVRHPQIHIKEAVEAKGGILIQGIVLLCLNGTAKGEGCRCSQARRGSFLVSLRISWAG